MRIIEHLWIRLQQLVPQPKAMCWENDYDRITWNDPRPLPTAEEIEVIDPIPYLPETIEAAKQTDIGIALPNWTQVETAINNITNLAGVKVFLLKQTRVIYWLAKNKAD